MRGPSSKTLKNRIDIYLPSTGSDVEGGLQLPYPTSPTYSQVACSVQPVAYREIADEMQNRLGQYIDYEIMLGQQLVLPARTQILWQNPPGTIHTLYVEQGINEAGRDGAFVVNAEEKV